MIEWGDTVRDMATLNGQQVCIGDSVYDIVHGPGKVVDASNGLLVSFGSAGRPRKYSSQGMTGKNCARTLFNRPPAIIEFPRDECDAAKLTAALNGVMAIFEDLTRESTCKKAQTCCCQPVEKLCGC